MEEQPPDSRFREGLGRLEALVGKLEGDDLELEDALAAYEEGLRLYRGLAAILADAEKRIEVLAGEKGDRLTWKKFPGVPAGGEGDNEQGGDRGPDG